MDIVGGFDTATKAVKGYGTAREADWINANPDTGQTGVYPPAEAFAHPMKELVAIERAAGLVPSHTDLSQLAQSVLRLANIPVKGWQSSPPGSPTEGDIYIVKPSGSGAWAGHDHAIALYLDEAWVFVPPRAGELATFVDSGAYTPLYFTGTAWARVPGVQTRIQSYTVGGSYTFTVPDDTTRVFPKLVGGGAGGAGSAPGLNAAGGGGGSGGYTEGWIDVTPGADITVIVGEGGIGGEGVDGWVAFGGGTTSFGPWLSATGGSGGRVGSASSAGGAPGLGAGGQLNLYGSPGGDGNNQSSLTPGGYGGASFFGGGGRTATSTDPAVNGLAPGSGGGGIWAAATAQDGGRGQDGALYVLY
ncbi:DUF2793 domain-containing protein [Amorphus sp. 3PC139-8]|uniref:DUF2793 domain-containing protein n=1 Tax=Amorphus sp. 3PC139-8 TaxID=2735676 RepID=UPI00345D7A2D